MKTACSGSSTGSRPTRADSNADAVRYLAKQAVLDRRLAESIGDAVGFRNVLVHQYADVDDRRTVEHLAQLDDLTAFSSAVARWYRDHDAGRTISEKS